MNHPGEGRGPLPRSKRNKLFKPVFGGAPFAASGERIKTPPETLNISLALLFIWR
ncbi:MAG: hypothetical protein RLZZ618_2202 [Pseudomonadota bacterium]